MGDLTKKIVRYGAIAVGIIFLVIVVLRFGKAFTSFQTDMSDADLRIANYQKEIMSENAKLEEADNALEASKAGVYSMKDPGAAVAVLQTKMVTMPVSIKLAKQEELNDKKQVLTDAQHSLGDYFSDNESRVWFSYNQPNTGRLVWKCITTYDTKQTDLKGVWICYANNATDTQLVAYATADYNVETKLFSNAKVYVTEYGKTLLLVDEEGNEYGD